MHLDMGGEDLRERMPIMIVRALAVDVAGGWIQKGEQVSGTISPIVKVLKGRLPSPCRQGGCETFKCLNACTLVKTVQVLRGIGIACNDMFHFREEVRICDLEVIFTAVGPQCMLQEDSMNGCTADRPAYHLKMFFEIPLCVRQ